MRLPPAANDIAAHWLLSGVHVGAALPTHPSRQAYEVQSNEGLYVVKLEPDPGVGVIHGAAVLDHLGRRGYQHAPALIHTRNWKQAACFGGEAACLLEYLPQTIDDEYTPQDTWWDLGQATARLNQDSSYVTPFGIPVEAALTALSQRAVGQPYERELIGLLDRVSELGNAAGSTLVHGEVNEANARRRTDGTVVLVDWDQAGRAGSAAFDYGYPLICIFISTDDLHIDAGVAQAYYAGYREAGGTIDQQQLFNAALFHALRYMWFADTEARWERIQYAVTHEEDLCSLIP